MVVLKVDKLTKNYGNFAAVDGISFEVNKGEMLGFLGVNGAGKSTTINMLSTLLKPDSGSAEICGCTLGREEDSIRRKIGVVFQHNCLDNMLSVRENLICRGVLHGASNTEAQKRLEELCEMLSLGERLRKRYSNLSGGQKRRCEIAAALMHTPELLFLDEPTTGLDPATRREVWSVVENLRQNTGMTVFLTTHYMEEAAKANRIIILERGKIMANGTPFELKESYAADTVKIYCSDSDAGVIKEKLSACGIHTHREDYGLQLAVKNTTDAIVLMLMLFFLGDMTIDNLTDILSELPGRDAKQDADHARMFVALWTCAGIVSINAVTVTLAVYSSMIRDRTEDRLDSICTAPISRWTISAAYVTSAWICSVIICVINTS